MDKNLKTNPEEVSKVESLLEMSRIKKDPDHVQTQIRHDLEFLKMKHGVGR